MSKEGTLWHVSDPCLSWLLRILAAAWQEYLSLCVSLSLSLSLCVFVDVSAPCLSWLLRILAAASQEEGRRRRRGESARLLHLTVYAACISLQITYALIKQAGWHDAGSKLNPLRLQSVFNTLCWVLTRVWVLFICGTPPPLLMVIWAGPSRAITCPYNINTACQDTTLLPGHPGHLKTSGHQDNRTPDWSQDNMTSRHWHTECFCQTAEIC